MRFTPTPQNGSSWQDSLLFGIDTEEEQPTDILLEVASQNESLVRRRLYGVTTAEVDIAPYLKHLSYIAPTIGTSAIIAPSPSAQAIRLIANEVSSEQALLFHHPYDATTPHIISYEHELRAIADNEPIILTAYAQESIQVNAIFMTKISSRNFRLSAQTMGMPMNIIIPSTLYPSNVERIVVEITLDDTTLRTLEYNPLPQREKAWCVAWFNKRGGLETYTFPSSLRLSYDATINSEYASTAEHYTPIASASVRHRLCSAYETQEQIERLSEMVFSPRIFLINGRSVTPITLCNRHIEFDNHGSLRQMCIEIEQPWKGETL